MKPTKLLLPCMRGRMGDWIYYVTLMNFAEVAKRVKLPKEIDAKYDSEDLKLGDWIQRELSDTRTKHIAQYLLKQEQRFFNALILGVYNGEPQWQEVTLEGSAVKLEEEEKEDLEDYLSKTFGILNLNGAEDIFAIDGQHRAIGIREAVKTNKQIGGDDQCVIFIVHKPTAEGKVRTRRVFSTLNKYAKPVSPTEIIALSEDSNSAILTRRFVDTDTFLKDKVQVNRNRSIHPSNKTHLTNIMLLHDIITILATNKNVAGNAVTGHDHDAFITERLSDDKLDTEYRKISDEIKRVFSAAPSVAAFLKGGEVNRTKANTNLLFRPIGQTVIFSAYRILKEHRKSQALLDYLKKDDFNLANSLWKRVFWDDDTKEIDTKASKQKAAILHLVALLGVQPKRTVTDEKTLKALGLLK